MESGIVVAPVKAALLLAGGVIGVVGALFMLSTVIYSVTTFKPLHGNVLYEVAKLFYSLL